MKEHNTNLALQLVPASSRPRVVGEPRLWIAEALEVCDTSVVARRLSCSQELVRGWRTGKSLPNLDHLARAPRRFSLRVLTCLGGDQAVTRASVAFLQAVAAGEGGAVLAELARGLATAVLEIPEALDDPTCEAIVLRIDSPGGYATQLAERLLSPEVVEGEGEEVAS